MKAASFIVIIVSGVLYQVCSKSIPSDVNPFIPLLCTYAIAFLTTGILYLCSGNLSQMVDEFKKINFFSFLLGAVICFYELGFILAYRNGFSLTTLPGLANIFVIIVVSIVGVIFFHEQLTLLRIGGFVIAVGGIALTLL